VRPARKADNLIAICEPTVYKMWEPRRLTTLWASTACYRDNRCWLNIRNDTFERQCCFERNRRLAFLIHNVRNVFCFLKTLPMWSYIQRWPPQIIEIKHRDNFTFYYTEVNGRLRQLRINRPGYKGTGGSVKKNLKLSLCFN
jgi:hypothetical protein